MNASDDNISMQPNPEEAPLIDDEEWVDETDDQEDEDDDEIAFDEGEEDLEDDED